MPKLRQPKVAGRALERAWKKRHLEVVRDCLQEMEKKIQGLYPKGKPSIPAQSNSNKLFRIVQEFLQPEAANMGFIPAATFTQDLADSRTSTKGSWVNLNNAQTIYRVLVGKCNCPTLNVSLLVLQKR